MINWSTDEKQFKKQHPREYGLWLLTQLINYGLDGDKLSGKMVKRNWGIIKENIDPDRATYLEFLLWNKKPTSLSFKSDYWKLS